jgi:hypothetical protein
MTTLQLSKILKISQRAVSSRCQSLGLQKQLINGRWSYFITKEQAKIICKLQPEVKKVISENVEIIYVHTIFNIYPSKLNYLEV